MSTMTHQTAAGAVPAWTLGWRLQRALGHADIKVEDMAEELGVSRSTLSRWMNDRGAAPRPIFVKQWAMRCGVSYDWLATGATVAEDDDNGPDGEGLPRLDSNQQPAGYGELQVKPATVHQLQWVAERRRGQRTSPSDRRRRVLQPAAEHTAEAVTAA